jgi:hypothetical protein
MFLKMFGVMAVAVALSAAPAYAMGGGGGKGHGSFSGSGAVAGAFDNGTFQGQCSAGSCSGTYVYSASEPLAALPVGLGLLGARFLRRR